jgi:hypothetical protein
MFKKYKISALLITLLTGLIFSGSVSAAYSNDEYRCKIDYMQLDMTNSEETSKHHTNNLEASSHEDACVEAGENILNKIYDWLHLKVTNVVVDVTTNMQCKVRGGMLWWKSYGKYKRCETYVNGMMATDIVNKKPDQVGHTVTLRSYLNK